MWHVAQLYTTGILRVALAGDFNLDGKVDAADYVVWRKNVNNVYTTADFNLWRAHHGQTAGSGSGAFDSNATATVPEPTTLMSLALMLCGSLAFNRSLVTCKSVRGA